MFKAKFTTVDGAGRPKATQAIIPTKRKTGVNPPFSRTSGPDSNSCFGCHNDPVEGGSGDDVANVFVSEGFESAQFDNIDPSFSSERHTIALMGAGLVELLAREMTADLQAIRADAVKRACASGEDVRADLVSKGVRFGWIVAHPDGMVDLDSVDGVDADLIVRPFSRKGVFASLRQFTINALNVHHGMEAVRALRRALDRKPRLRRERRARRGDAGRRLGPRRLPGDAAAADGESRPAGRLAQRGGRRREAVRRDRLRLLPREDAAPEVARLHRSRALRHGGNACAPPRSGRRSASTFRRFPSPRRCKSNDKGEWLIPLFSDLKRHLIVDDRSTALGNELQAQRFVERDVFLTPRLWGVGSTAPYGHNGAFRMLDEIIAAHGGDARFCPRRLSRARSRRSATSIVAFLRSLVIEAP